MLKRLIPFTILMMVKIFSHVFYRAKYTWLTEKPESPWTHAKIIALMNHTSLWEPLYIQEFSPKYLWHLSGHLNVPGADITLNRPIVGRFWKLMVPGITSISRKKDATWDTYMSTIEKDSIVMLAPEGRMKRPNGLDKNGKSMTVKPGIIDIIEDLNEGGLILCLSGGLHHVQAPGQLLPRLFKDIQMNFVYLDIPTYKAQFSGSLREQKMAMVNDLQRRLETQVPI